ncbi:MAG: proline--tRNA ligase [Candidatus Margulisbacteria bacterium]|nr:proline--tRNA ligase [Candidatus Margulisiibacteriota bacterium]
MRMSRLLVPTLREDPSEAEIISHKLLLRGGFIRKVAAGIYTFLPLGFKVLQNVARVIREEMNRSGAQEIFMPVLIPSELWQETGRWDIYGKELFRVTDRHERLFCLGPTHEEVITDLVRTSLRSYKQLPINLYQIQTKFRDEIRPRFGLMRGREFMMKDAYSFHTSEEDLDREYREMHETYCCIFTRLGLDFRVVEADPGLIGGNFSQEFMLLADSGEEEILACPQCQFAVNWKSFANEGESCPKCQGGALIKKRGIEVGHIFKLGTKYSEKMKCVYLDENNQEKSMIMGCYGIGVGRTAQAAIEQKHDENGIIWPLPLAPFKAAILPVDCADKEQMAVAEKIYQSALGNNLEVVLDDRPDRVGTRLKDIDLIGIPFKVIIGPRGLKEGKVEIKGRASGKTDLVPILDCNDILSKLISGQS